MVFEFLNFRCVGGIFHGILMVLPEGFFPISWYFHGYGALNRFVCPPMGGRDNINVVGKKTTGDGLSRTSRRALLRRRDAHSCLISFLTTARNS